MFFISVLSLLLLLLLLLPFVGALFVADFLLAAEEAAAAAAAELAMENVDCDEVRASCCGGACDDDQVLSSELNVCLA